MNLKRHLIILALVAWVAVLQLQVYGLQSRLDQEMKETLDIIGLINTLTDTDNRQTGAIESLTRTFRTLINGEAGGLK